jgi:hypothetical protein
VKLARLTSIAVLLLLPAAPLTAVPAAAAATSTARTSSGATGPSVLVSVLSGTCPAELPGAATQESQQICLDIAFTATGIPAGETRTITVQLLGHNVFAPPGTLAVFDADYQTFTFDSGANGTFQTPQVGCQIVAGAQGILSHHEFRVVPGPGIALAAGSIVTSGSFECPGGGSPGFPPTGPVTLASTGGFDFRLLAAGLAMLAVGLALFLLGRGQRQSTRMH